MAATKTSTAKKKPTGSKAQTAGTKTGTARKKSSSTAGTRSKSTASGTGTKRKGTSAGRKSTQTSYKRKTSAAGTGRKKTAYSSTKKSASSASRSKRSSSAGMQKRINRASSYSFPILKEILMILSVAICILLFVSCFQGPGSSLSWLQIGVFNLFGQAAYIIPIILFAALCLIMLNNGESELGFHLSALGILGICACGFMNLVFKDGGIIGNTLIEKALIPAVGRVGAYVVMFVFAIISVVLLTGYSLIYVLRKRSMQAMDAMRASQEVLKSEHELRVKERELYREQERNRRLEERLRRMEELEEERERELARREELELMPVRGITDVTLDFDEDDLDSMMAEPVKKKKGFLDNWFGADEGLDFDEDDLDEDDLDLDDFDLDDEESEKEDFDDGGLEINGIAKESDEEESYEPTEEFKGEIHFGNQYAEDNSAKDVDLQTVTTDNIDIEDIDVKDIAMEDVTAGNTQEEEVPWTPEDFAIQEDDILKQAMNEETKEETAEVPSVNVQQSSSVYEQKLPPDSGVTTDWKNTYSNTSARELAPNRTKTVTTATGKVITVELDGLPGEGKRPKEVPVPKSKEEDTTIVIPKEEELKEYVFPPLSYLKRGSSAAASKEETAQRLKDTAMKLQQTLQNFGVGVTVTDISCGPSVTRYELQPAQGVKVSRIVSLTDDIKLNLAASDIRMEAPIPGKAAIGIEVPNEVKQAVALRDLLESEEFKKHPSKVVFAAGKDIGGSTILADIAKMPHLLIAGATGSGKSVCINTIVMSILYKAKPSEVKLIMIDPKVVELSVYNGIPHLLIPVVTDPKKAAGALNWAVTEMTDRYKKFAEYRVRDMKGYNEKVDAAIQAKKESGVDNGEEIPKKMPQIVIIVDELADLMMVAPGDVEEAICRLAQMARAAGIHLVIATQRPSVNVITGLIKANVPSRIAFSVSSGVDSRTIIDMNGAEKLLGKGDMLFYPSGYPKPLRVQGCFVSDEEVSDVVKYLSEQKNVIGGEQDKNIELAASSQSSGENTAKSDQDEYFVKAGRFIIEKDKASIGMLQRVFKIGFNRAARIMDQLAQAGVVSEEEGTKPRKVLMTMEEFENTL